MSRLPFNEAQHAFLGWRGESRLSLANVEGASLLTQVKEGAATIFAASFPGFLTRPTLLINGQRGLMPRDRSNLGRAMKSRGEIERVRLIEVIGLPAFYTYLDWPFLHDWPTVTAIWRRKAHDGRICALTMGGKTDGSSKGLFLDGFLRRHLSIFLTPCELIALHRRCVLALEPPTCKLTARCKPQ